MKVIIGLLICLSLPNFAFAIGACTNPAEESPYTNCILNSGYIACQAANPSCDYFNYYINPNDPVSKMITQCCGLSNATAKRNCFISRRNAINAAVALPKKFRKKVVSTVNSYINNPELFCTEH